jgi:esterase
MGGKAVMALTALAPERIAAWWPLISPRWIITFAAMMRSSPPSMPSPTPAPHAPAGGAVMREHLQEEGVIQFLLKSFVDGQWRFNVPVLWDQYAISSAGKPFRPGRTQRCLSRRQLPYVTDAYRDALLAQFPQARAHVIAGAGHWVHAEKPEAVCAPSAAI